MLNTRRLLPESESATNQPANEPAVTMLADNVTGLLMQPYLLHVKAFVKKKCKFFYIFRNNESYGIYLRH